MAVVTVRRDRIHVTPRADNRVVKLIRVPDSNIVFAVSKSFADAYRKGAA